MKIFISNLAVICSSGDTNSSHWQSISIDTIV